ncbi:phospholipase A1 PLIP1, chloroplastic isoform X2 [Cicer arietinum]|uniref:Phospholipase A1 PLIP1, chloroplastic isoform X2 n=1 Tax=Cicer arietinum TaxID=3827 RepID=A0A1S2XWN8_CICAR|nr:phospholipase A1 PLIP1, chloroplastic isoform X2 [Cicer arietinum]
MACTAVAMPTSPATMDIAKEHNGLRRSHSINDIYTRSIMRRSYSDNHLCCSFNRIKATSVQPKLKHNQSMGTSPFQFSGSILPNSLRSFLFDQQTSKDIHTSEKDINFEENSKEERVNRANWIERLVEIKKHWRNRIPKESIDMDVICDDDNNTSGECDCDDDSVCMVDYDDEEEVTYDRDSFSKFLVQVPWSDTKLYSQLAFLCNMAYEIPQIKAQELRKYYSLQFITSSLEKKAAVAKLKEKLNQDLPRIPMDDDSVASDQDSLEKGKDNEQKPQIRLAYDIAASAASYVQLQTKNLLSLAAKSQQSDNEDSNEGREDSTQQETEGTSPRAYKSEVAAYMAASTVTSVVAAGEREKQEAANNLQSLHSSPCEWFVCDDFSNYTRCFVIQGSDSLASWQANLFFEPTKFENTEVIVHRGIYEAAKGIYEQFMPEILDHLKRHGDRAKLQFTGHSLGGSLSLLVHLMLLTRKVVSSSTLRPVVTFGSPFVFCGGQKLIDELGLDESHIHCVMMHRDIVPRAFSCNYPDHVAVLLKRLNRTFRSHPCLTKNKLLYSPMGKIFILQPDEKTSPPHPLLPSENAFYALDSTIHGYSSRVLSTFLNQPHPIETLSDPTAYGSEGTILRDHDSSNYLKAVNGILIQHSKTLVGRVRKQRIDELWPTLTSPSPHSWSHEQNMERCSLMTKEITTGV